MTKAAKATKPHTTRRKSTGGKTPGASKLDTLIGLLKQPTGATIAELTTATGWQTHSVRGALAGSLKKKGHTISSEVRNGVRRYRIAEARA